ncbi:hypothetical protein BGZ96_011523 [Linnemannia gamsii]|uniref:Uncharacterized protein n=1 Tax=Linnemannia gamsii TaxID=64522 RepID=A0ABQ7JS59_9FUNG|nr:hypothetical protein BGZ96_011523 [Linnemannia gamsii]
MFNNIIILVPQAISDSEGAGKAPSYCIAVMELLFSSHCPACKEEIKEVVDLPVHGLKSIKWPEDIASHQGDSNEVDAQLINSTRHMATVRSPRTYLKKWGSSWLEVSGCLDLFYQAALNG